MQESNVRHLRGLQAFDVAARCSNLSRAAEELGVTHGAVSRQIKQLETYLGVALLHRLPNGVEKTDSGERLHQATGQAFAALRDGVRDVSRENDRHSITVSLSTSLATQWLVPNLASFRAGNPEVTVFLDTNDDIVDLHSSRIDVALRYGKPGWGGLHCERLTHEELVVVAAPHLVASKGLPMTARDVAELPLLHDEFNPAWDRWAEARGLDVARVENVAVKFGDSSVLIAAAIDGQGVALARRLLVKGDLQAGRLVRLDDTITSLDRALYFVCRPGDEKRALNRRFKQWLQALLQQQV